MRVLIVSPDAGFGGLIQQTLDNAGGYEPVLVVNGRQALELASKLQFDLAILDADLAGFSIVELGMALQTLSPDISMILIPNDGNEQEFADTGLHIGGYLSKPFFLPDLLELVGRVAQDQASSRTLTEGTISVPGIVDTVKSLKPEFKTNVSVSEPVSTWLDDVNRAAQHLASLSMATASQAALILKNGRLWAYAGHLSKEAAQELAQIVQHDWKRTPSAPSAGGSSTDLARFVRLKVSGDDYMLYATGLGVDMVLVLAFDIRTPISKIHAQAGELARALASAPELEKPGLITAQGGESNGVISLEESRGTPEKLPPLPEEGLPSLLPFEDVPPPTPPGYQGELPQFEQIHWPWEYDSEFEETPEEEANISVKFTKTDDTVAGRKVSAPVESFHPEGATSPDTTMQGDRWSQVDSQATGESLRLSSDDLRAVPGVILSSPVVYVIHYACVLLPRLPGHRLTKDIHGQLTECMHRLSIAFGWRLEYVAIFLDYMHWITGASPEISADEVIQKVRRHTTEMIFSEFPSYSRGNLCDDFWAPGYLVVTGSNPLPAELVNEYIEQTRLRQGIAGKG